MGWWGGGLCDFIVTLVPIGLGFQFLTGLGLVLGLGRLNLGLGLDNRLIDKETRGISVEEVGKL